jgi:membrane fusion protein (multidrug efflux system)
MQAVQSTEIPSLTEARDTNQDNQQKRKRMFKILALVVAIAAMVSYGYWALVASKHVTTDNAYAAADVAQVTPSINGIVKAINVVDTQKVKAGDTLVVLDDMDARVALKQAEANYARSEADLQRTKINFERRQKLAGSGFVSKEELSNSDSMLKVAKANFELTSASLEQARLDLSRTIILAPIDGIVAKREVELGQRIAAGTHLLSIIPMSQIYVNANFKEVQLTHVKVGQAVELYADIYGSSVIYHGRVIGLSGGTGAAFALIPAQNATGNWIKVVQRLPVRIALDQHELTHHPLEVGLSMHADIHIGKTNQ